MGFVMQTREVHLHGFLGEKYGSLHMLAVSSPAEAVRALSILNHGFRKDIISGNWRVIAGSGDQIGEDQLDFVLGRQSLHIVPVVEGAGDLGSSLGKIVGGIALAAGAFFLGPSIPLIGAIVSQAGVGIGLAMVSAGASSLLTPHVAASNGRSGVDERASLVFGGVENVSVQGGAVPLVFGEFLVGSVVISAGLATEQV